MQGLRGIRKKAPPETTLQDFRETYETNVFGVAMVTNALLPMLSKSDDGRIINQSAGLGSHSMTARMEPPLVALNNWLAYNSSKAALNSITLEYAKYTRGTSLRVFATSPGLVSTALNGHRRGGISPAEGASVAVRLATIDPPPPSGSLGPCRTNGVVSRRGSGRACRFHRSSAPKCEGSDDRRPPALAFSARPAHTAPQRAERDLKDRNMGFKCGIVGLPNVGKSTLFNALTQTAAAQAANYPFCTIEPNVGDVAVPDPRLEVLPQIAGSKEIIPTRLTFVDIAGLVRGASKGEGLGNQFLANIRECDAIAHVVRCFEDGDITHVEGKVDPIRDIETIETELMLADLESLEKRVTTLEKKAKGGDKESKEALALVERCLALLREGKPARLPSSSTPEERKAVRGPRPAVVEARALRLQRRGSRPPTGNAILRARLGARERGRRGRRRRLRQDRKRDRRSAGRASRRDYLEAVGLAEPGLNRVIRAGYELLHLVTYFTVGPKEARAWTIEKGTRAPQAAGVIHTDFEKGFIRSETIAYDDYVALQGRSRRARGRQVPAGRQGICRRRRRRAAFPLQYLKFARATRS